MKHNILSLLTICTLLLLGITSCDQCKQELPAPQQPVTPQPNPFRPPSELPPATQHGANTFGCRINGENWVFWIPPFALTDETSFLIYENNNNSGWANCYVRVWRDTLQDGFLMHNTFKFEFEIKSFDPVILDKVSFDSNIDNAFRFYLSNTISHRRYYPDTTRSTLNNRFIIDRIDRDSNIIAGRFDVVLYLGEDYEITDRTDSIVISDGRFDFIYDEN